MLKSIWLRLFRPRGICGRFLEVASLHKARQFLLGLSMEDNFPKTRRDKTEQGTPEQDTTRRHENTIENKTPKRAPNPPPAPWRAFF